MRTPATNSRTVASLTAGEYFYIVEHDDTVSGPYSHRGAELSRCGSHAFNCEAHNAERFARDFAADRVCYPYWNDAARALASDMEARASALAASASILRTLAKNPRHGPTVATEQHQGA